jgi:hypothetical protein
MQASDHDITSGSVRDWLFGDHGILAYTVELGREFYPGPTEIAREWSRVRDAFALAIAAD